MKSIVICCAIAISLEFVASIPYSTDSQRYSGYNARPSLEPPYQVNSQRPYYSNQRYNGGAYRAPIPQVQQEQKVPIINREHYFPRQQQRYQSKGPPQQAEINNAKYFNQQNAANAYDNSQIQEIRNQNAATSFPEPAQINPETFVPAIPVIPSVPQYTPQPSSEFLTKVEYNRPAIPPQFKEVELPIIQPTPPVEYASVRKDEVNDVDRFLARAADPVEQILPTKRPNRPLVEIFLSRPNIRNVLATTKHKKRYLVIHPDGTVEHVDKIENVAERHPNYVLVNAGDINTNLQRIKPVTATPTPQSPLPGNWISKKIDNINHHTLTTVSTYKENSPVEIEPAQVAPLPVQAPLEEHHGVPEPSVIAPDTAVAEVVFPPTDLIDIKTHVSEIHPSEIIIKKEVLPPNNVDNISESEPISAVPETEVSSSSSLTNPPKNELVNVESSLREIVNKVAIDNPDTLEEDIVPTNVLIDAPPASNTASSVLQDYIKELAFVEEYFNKAEVELSIPDNKTVNHDNSSTTVKHLNNQQPTDDPEILDSFKEFISKLNEQVSDKNSQLKLSSDNGVPNLGDLDISKVHAKPAVWFKTTDPDVLEKLTQKDKGLDLVYFFQIHNQPKIEKDIKSTIHPNGTIVEDTIETTWAFEGDGEPTITKSTKIIHPEDL